MSPSSHGSRFLRPRSFATAVLVGLFSLALSQTSLAAEKAPGFSLKDTEGKVHNLSDYGGKVVLLSFWATWCTPCLAEMPKLEEIYKDLGPQGLVILSISADDARSSSQVKPVIKSKGVTYPVLLDRETAVVALYNPAKTLPYSVIIDAQGQIVSVHSGYNPGDEARLAAEIRALLVPPATAPAPTP
jgi:peroxiredoxin